MTRVLRISPSGVNELRDAHLTPATAAGRNEVVVLNDEYYVASDNTYTNTE